MTTTRGLWPLLSSIVALGLLLAACAPAATPTPRPAAPPAVAPTLAPQVTPPTPTPPAAAKPTPLAATATPAPAPKPEAKTGEEPRYGGVLKVLNNTDLPHFDMHQETTSKMQNPLSPAYNHLITWDAADENKLLPALAERWEVSPDNKAYTFYLRKGVKFHDGTPLTAADVKITFDRQAGFTEAFSPRRDWLAALQRVEVVDDLTVKMYLKYPSASFLTVVGEPYHFIFPKHIIDQKGDMKRTVLGTGPFKFKEYMRGVKFSLEKNPDYWGKGQPYLDGIDWYIILDAGAQFAAIRTGQVQVEIPVNHALLPAQVSILKKEIPGIQLQDRNWALNHYFGVNVQRKPWTDIRVRKAAFLAMDREAWLKVVLQGSGEIGGFFIPGGYYAYTLDELRTWPGYGKDKDKERAEGKKLMAEAGYPDGLELGEGIIVRNTKEQMDIAIFAADQLSKVGIKAVVRPLDSAEHKLRLFNRNFDTGVKRAIGHGEPDIIGANYFVTGGGENFAGVSVPEIDKLYAEQAQTVDPAKRKALVQKAEKLYYEQYGSLILGWVTGPAILWPEVRGWNNPNRPFLPSRMWEKVWLAK